MKTPYLKDCAACGNSISRRSPLCRHCGHPQGNPLAIWALGIFLLMMVAFYIAMTVYCACHVQRFRVYGPQQERGVELYAPDGSEQ